MLLFILKIRPWYQPIVSLNWGLCPSSFINSWKTTFQKVLVSECFYVESSTSVHQSGYMGFSRAYFDSQFIIMVNLKSPRNIDRQQVLVR